MIQKKGRVLLVEDDDEIGKLVIMALNTNDYQYEWGKNGTQAMMLIASYHPDVILLDLGLPDIDGLKVITYTRKLQLTPIIIISARSDESDKISALDLGADDYLIKPFSIAELLARVRVAFRRNAFLDSNVKDDRMLYSNGPLMINYESHTVLLNKTHIHLTNIEYKLLVTLAVNNNRVLTHRYLLKHVWGFESSEDTSLLRVAIATLRKKIEPNSNSIQLIQTYIGVGYRLIQN